MVRKKTIENLILKTEGNFTAKNLVKNYPLIFSDYKKDVAKSYITVVLHDLWKKRQIKKVKRGLFTNSSNFVEIDWNDWNSIIDFYTKEDNGFIAKDFLYYKNNLVSTFPQKLVVYSNLVTRKKIKGNIEIRPTKIVINQYNKAIFEIYEIIRILNYNEAKDVKKLKELLDKKRVSFSEMKKYSSLFKMRYKKFQKFLGFFNI